MLCNVCKACAVPCAKLLQRNENAVSQENIFGVSFYLFFVFQFVLSGLVRISSH